MQGITRILGLDPGLNHTGWGVIETSGSSLRYVAAGRVDTPPVSAGLSARLAFLFTALQKIVAEHAPDEAAIEETFMNNNAASAIKLGMARGVVFLAPAMAGLSVAEYGANLIKKSVSGYGHADKNQVAHMVKILLPKAVLDTPDAADALAVAICHAHHRNTPAALKEARA